MLFYFRRKIYTYTICNINQKVLLVTTQVVGHPFSCDMLPISDLYFGDNYFSLAGGIPECIPETRHIKCNLQYFMGGWYCMASSVCCINLVVLQKAI